MLDEITVSGVLVGVLGSLIAAIIWYVVMERLPILPGRKAFSISGVWYSEFPAPDSCGHSIEIVRVRQIRDRVALYIENYNATRPRHGVLRLKGYGIYRNSILCSYYYFQDLSNPDVGVFALKSQTSEGGGTIMKGVFTQFIQREHVYKDEPHTQTYILRRVDLPFHIQLRRLVGTPYLGDYNAAVAYLQGRGLLKEDQNAKFESTPN